MDSGIYKIVNIINKKFYIGSASNLKKRIYNHKLMLKNGNHTNIHLQRASEKYGLDAFSFEILEECTKEQLREHEQKLLDKFVGNINCYNIAHDATAPTRGLLQSEETKLKKSLALKGKSLSEEHKKKIGLANKGNVYSKEIRQQISNRQLGRKLSTEWKDSIKKNMPRGSALAVSKLKESDIPIIREMYASDDYSHEEIANIYDVTRKCIMNIVHRKTWTHID